MFQGDNKAQKSVGSWGVAYVICCYAAEDYCGSMSWGAGYGWHTVCFLAGFKLGTLFFIAQTKYFFLV